MMKKNKILLIINSLEDIEFFQKLEISNFLFPLEDFSVGYNAFTLNDIKSVKIPCYLLVNRLLNDDDIDSFLKLDIPENVKGLVVEDIGLYYELKDSGLELINFQNHLNNSSTTVNFWLNYYDSLVLSTDITLDEIKEMLDVVSKPLVIKAFGYPMIMYSRRKLIGNYFEYKNQERKETLDIRIKEQVDFKMRETEFGTAVFDNHLLDIRKELEEVDDEKVKFYLFSAAFLTRDVIERALKGEVVDNITKGFLNTKTIYRVVKK